MGKEKLISLDLSTKASGVAMWENGKYKSSAVINCESEKNVDVRIRYMSKELWKYLDYYSPDVVYAEDTYCHGNPEVQKKLNRIQGVVYAWCIQHDAEFHLLMPSAWRKYIPEFPNYRTKREEQKKFSVNYVRKNYGFEPVTDDQSDAICLGEAAICIMNEKDILHRRW